MVINAGLQDQSVGYSARLPLMPSPQAPAAGTPPAVSDFSFAELGLMSGAADPMMNFPSGTVFTPYSLVRNISGQSATVTPTLWWMVAGTPKSSQLSKVAIAPHRTLNLNIPALIAAAGLQNFNGSVNVILDTNGPSGTVAAVSGSVDKKNTYVFEVFPHGIIESAAKSASYWSTANGDDTMITLWNPADEDQDLVYTLFFSGGRYLYPIHLAARATRTFNISEITGSATPDSEGNVVPAGMREGSAEIAGSQGEHQHILVSMETGIYNVSKAVCSPTCETCQGETNLTFIDQGFNVPTSATHQETFYMTWSSGAQYDLTSQSTWSSNATNVATVSSGLVNGVSPGSVTISAFDSNIEQPYVANYCYFVNPACPSGGPSQGSGQGATTPTVSITGALNFAFVGSDPTVPKVLQQAVGKPSGGTYSWTASPPNRVSFDSPSADVVHMSGSNYSSSIGDTTITVTYTQNGQSANPPATLAVTSRLLKFLQQPGSTQVVPITGPPHYGYISYVYYNVYTFPGGQILQPGFGGITVYETVSLTGTNFPVTEVIGSGATTQNSQVIDQLSVYGNSPLPSNFSATSDQYLGVGGFIVRHNTITQTATGPSIANLGPYN